MERRNRTRSRRKSSLSFERGKTTSIIPVKTPDEIERIRNAGRIVGRTLAMLGGKLKAGITTKELDEMAEDFIRGSGALPAFKGYRGYPASICVSVNEQVVHGIPGGREIREGDLVSIDCGAIYDGFYGDAACSWHMGIPPERTARLMDATKRALEAGIDKMRPGNTVGDISNAVQRAVESEGFSVVRDLVGHGVGRHMHEEPQVPNYGRAGAGALIREGMVFAIEPMVNMGRFNVKTLDDGWTVVAADGLPSCHFEHTVAARESGPDVLTLE